MKYIVVYTILILGLTSLKSAAQKPNIALLPTASESMHPEALIDTCITIDALFRDDSVFNRRDPAREPVSDFPDQQDPSPVQRGKAPKVAVLIKQRLYHLPFKKFNPISFIIRLTALKI